MTGRIEQHESVSANLRIGNQHLVADNDLLFADLSRLNGTHTMAPVTLDAGIVFADRSSYPCFPIERLGIPQSCEIVLIGAFERKAESTDVPQASRY